MEDEKKQDDLNIEENAEKESEMTEEPVSKEQEIQDELVEILRSSLPAEELSDKLHDYHEKDIADALEVLTSDERKALYPILGAEYVSEIFAYVDEPEEYFAELNLEKDNNGNY